MKKSVMLLALVAGVGCTMQLVQARGVEKIRQEIAERKELLEALEDVYPLERTNTGIARTKQMIDSQKEELKQLKKELRSKGY